MEELDKLFRERIDQLHTPPPQSQWTPGRSWERLEVLIEPAKPVPLKRLSYYSYYAAALLALLLIPMGWLLIRFDTEEQDGVSVAPHEKRSAAVAGLPQSPEDTLPPRSITQNTQTRIRKKQLYTRKTNQAKKIAPAERTSPMQPEVIMLPEMTTHLEPVRNQAEHNADEVAISGGSEEVKAYLSQTAAPDHKRTNTTVTIVFPGKGERAEAAFSRETAKPRRNKILRLFTNGQTEDQTEPAGESTNIFSILTEKKQ